MARRYITSKTARLYKASTGGSFDWVMIFGDEIDVQTQGSPVNGRRPATYRGRPGFVREDQMGPEAALEMYFIDVGQGDAAFIVTPGRRKILVDGGFDRRALGFLTWKYRLDRPNPQPLEIDLLVLSHADRDHIDGLTPIIEHPFIHVKRILHNGIATFASGAKQTSLGDRDPNGDFLLTRHDALSDLAGESLSADFGDWRDAIEAEGGVTYEAVDSSTGTVDIGEPDVVLEIVGPRLGQHNGQPALPWLKDKSHTINGHSVAFRLTYGQVSSFFSGDLNVEGSEHLLQDPTIAGLMDAHVFKSPHHGSHEFEPALFTAVRPQISVVSSGDTPDHGHPRASFLGAIGRQTRSSEPLLFSTEIAATFQDASDPPGTATSLEGLSGASAAERQETRRRFKRRLHGMINVRTDGDTLYSARRVTANYQWESYEQDAVPRWQV